MRDTHPVDATAHYRHLAALGRDEFLAASAAAALVRYRPMHAGSAESFEQTLTMDEARETVEETLTHGKVELAGQLELEVYPLVKKPGASFPDRITIGRTGNNDIVIPDHSISRFHAYVKKSGDGWLVADAGSKNGSWLRGHALEARRERPLPSRGVLRLGDVDLTFYVARDLYEALGGPR